MVFLSIKSAIKWLIPGISSKIIMALIIDFIQHLPNYPGHLRYETGFIRRPLIPMAWAFHI